MAIADITPRTQLDQAVAPVELYRRSGDHSRALEPVSLDPPSYAASRPRERIVEAPAADPHRRGVLTRSVLRRSIDPARRTPRTTRWAVTIAATALSTYALEAIATAAGIALAASHVLRGLDQVLLLGFLGGSYVVWGAGLRLNLRANWALLEQTGTSTNALSKAAHDLAKLRAMSLRARRRASAIGYVGTELAKEAPYYAGAFGATIVTSSISSTDALIFLAGTNLGAAVYEYALARGTRAFLSRRSRRRDGAAPRAARDGHASNAPTDDPIGAAAIRMPIPIARGRARAPASWPRSTPRPSS